MRVVITDDEIEDMPDASQIWIIHKLCAKGFKHTGTILPKLTGTITNWRDVAKGETVFIQDTQQ